MVRFRKEEQSTNIEDRRRKKHHKKLNDDDYYYLTVDVPSSGNYGQTHKVSRAEVDRMAMKYRPPIEDDGTKPKVRRYKKIDAQAHNDLKAPAQDPPLPRKRPSQVYIEAPKPKTKRNDLRGPVILKKKK